MHRKVVVADAADDLRKLRGLDGFQMGQFGLGEFLGKSCAEIDQPLTHDIVRHEEHSEPAIALHGGHHCEVNVEISTVAPVSDHYFI